jgi:hypothetical protein
MLCLPQVSSCDESSLKAAVARTPVAVAISAMCVSFQNYGGGVLNEECFPQKVPCSVILDHAVTLVGYGTDTETGQDYWVIKNSECQPIAREDMRCPRPCLSLGRELPCMVLLLDGTSPEALF